jgi:hypothetical protein
MVVAEMREEVYISVDSDEHGEKWIQHVIMIRGIYQSHDGAITRADSDT